MVASVIFSSHSGFVFSHRGRDSVRPSAKSNEEHFQLLFQKLDGLSNIRERLTYIFSHLLLGLFQLIPFPSEKSNSNPKTSAMTKISENKIAASMPNRLIGSWVI